MSDDDEAAKPKPGPLPGNQGQFGANDATEEFKPLENHPDAAEPGAQGSKQTNAGERS